MRSARDPNGRVRAERVAAAVDAERSCGALVRLSSETEFVALSTEFRALCASLARTSARLRSGDVDEVSAATLSESGAAPALHDLSRRCGESLVIERLELFESALASGAATRADGEGAVLVQLLGDAPATVERDVCERLAAHALRLESDARSRRQRSHDPTLHERWVLDEAALDRLRREHAPDVRLVRMLVRWRR